MSKNVKYSTTQKTGLNVGCYRIKDHDNVQERIVIITDKGGDIPVKVTNLERDHKQIEVSKNLKNSTPLRLILPNAGGGGLADSDLVDMPNNVASGNKPKNKSNAKKGKRKKDDFIVESDEEEEEVVLSSDSDDPSWGSSKRKNANKGKKKRK